MWLIHLVLVAGALYVAVISGMYLAQTWLIFPTTLVQAGHVPLPASAQRLEVETPSGDRLVGVLIPASISSGPRGPLLLGFGGNAWSADTMALLGLPLWSGGICKDPSPPGGWHGRKADPKALYARV